MDRLDPRNRQLHFLFPSCTFSASPQQPENSAPIMPRVPDQHLLWRQQVLVLNHPRVHAELHRKLASRQEQTSEWKNGSSRVGPTVRNDETPDVIPVPLSL